MRDMSRTKQLSDAPAEDQNAKNNQGRDDDATGEG